MCSSDLLYLLFVGLFAYKVAFSLEVFNRRLKTAFTIKMTIENSRITRGASGACLWSKSVIKVVTLTKNLTNSIGYTDATSFITVRVEIT